MPKMTSLIGVLYILLPSCGGNDQTGEVISEVGGLADCDYTQAFGNSTHTGTACPEVKGMRVAAKLLQDADADAENEFSGFLQIHESPPLTSGDFVVVPSKSGFVDGFDRSGEKYATDAYKWTPSVTTPSARLVSVWTYKTNWNPVDGIMGSLGSYTNGYVQQFAPAISGGSLYVPRRFGRVARVDLATGNLVTEINPFSGTEFDGDEQTIVINALSVDRAGNIYYTVTAFPDAGRNAQPRGSWLVQVHPDDSFRLVPWAQLATASVGIPSSCEYPFFFSPTGHPTGPDSKPPVFGCGLQRPAFNSAVSITPDGRTLVVFSYANNAQGAAFLITVDASTMLPMHASDTRGHLLYGCGVRLEIEPGSDCDIVTTGGTVNIGNDPDFNGSVRFRGEDLMDSTPAIAPNGDVSIGSYDGGFQGGGEYDARGGGVIFNSAGAFVAKNEDFWWEVTPSMLQRPDGTFSYLSDRGLFTLNDLSIARYSPAQQVQALSVHPNVPGQAFQDAHIVFGPTGDHYGMSSDGHLYKYGADGRLLEALPLLGDDGEIREMFTLSAYFARDRAGRIYVSHAGSVYVIQSAGPRPTPNVIAPTTPSPRVLAGMKARALSMAQHQIPTPPRIIANDLCTIDDQVCNTTWLTQKAYDFGQQAFPDTVAFQTGCYDTVTGLTCYVEWSAGAGGSVFSVCNQWVCVTDTTLP